MSRDFDRRITNLEVKFKKKGELIILNYMGIYSYHGQDLNVKTQEEAAALFPDKDVTFLEIVYEDEDLHFGAGQAASPDKED